MFDKLFQKIGDFFKHLFNGAQKAYDKLSQELKDALHIGATYVDILNQNLDKVPQSVLDVIQAEFPHIDIMKIEVALKTAAYELNLLDKNAEVTILDVIAVLQKYFKSKSGVFWANASDTVAKIIALIFAPDGTKATQIISLIWFVYQRYIKGVVRLAA